MCGAMRLLLHGTSNGAVADSNDLQNAARNSAAQVPVRFGSTLDLVSRRFAQVLLELEATSFQNLIPRLAALLLARAKRGMVKGITHKEIAEYLRVYRESATTALGELRKAGIIAVERKRIRIVDQARLERAAREQTSAKNSQQLKDDSG